MLLAAHLYDLLLLVHSCGGCVFVDIFGQHARASVRTVYPSKFMCLRGWTAMTVLLHTQVHNKLFA